MDVEIKSALLLKRERPVQPMAFSVRDAAQVLGIGRTKLYELIRDGELSVLKIGRRTLIAAAELAAFLNRGSRED